MNRAAVVELAVRLLTSEAFIVGVVLPLGAWLYARAGARARAFFHLCLAEFNNVEKLARLASPTQRAKIDKGVEYLRRVQASFVAAHGREMSPALAARATGLAAEFVRDHRNAASVDVADIVARVADVVERRR